MTFIEKIRNFFKTEEIKEINKEPPLEELPPILEKEKVHIESLKKDAKKQLSEKLSAFESELSGLILVLEKIDIMENREQVKLKEIVKENLSLYINYQKRLLENLRKIENSELQEYINKISNALNEFNKLSRISFERATILIGDEMKNAKSAVNSLVKEVNLIFEQNGNLLQKDNLLKKSFILLEETKLREINLKNSDSELEKLRDKANSLRKEIENANSKISEIKNSDKFLKDLKLKEEYKNQLEELQKEIYEAKNKIDLKKFIKTFYQNSEKAELIKSYRDNFKSALINDEELLIINILKTESGNIPDLSSLRKKIISFAPPQLKTETDIEQLENALSKLKSQLDSTELSVIKEEKKKEKLSIKLEEIKSELKKVSKDLFNPSPSFLSFLLIP